ncbi:MAG: HAD-IA family hydrolase, partial [Gammaproteobacteria bacterium]|nr:HAD-IA family hydrolase [Gammaproteobacteria bacterium]
MSIEAVIFDMDGLMLDTEPLYKMAWQRAGGELGFEIDDCFYATLIGRPIPDCEADLVRKFDADFPLEKFQRRWPQLWKQEADKGIALKSGLSEILDLIRAERLPVAVATSSDTEYMKFSLSKAGLTGRFEVVVTGDTVRRGKPAPDIYLEAARRLNVSPSKCLALEDSEAGVVAANAAGMMTILIPDVIAPTAVAIGASNHVMESLLSAVDYLKNRLVAECHMKLAIAEGRKAVSICGDNPPVGCVLVRNKVVIAQGHTNAPGEHHAEAMALQQVSGVGNETIAFVTLEPCSFHGRTPSCALALIEAGIQEVYVGILDPDPRNNGRGVAMLKAAGIKVHLGILA